MGDFRSEFLFGSDAHDTIQYDPTHYTFSSLADAQDAILHVQACVTSEQLQGQAANHVHNIHMAAWSYAFDNFLASQQQPLSNSCQRAIALLELMRYHVGVSMLGWHANEDTYIEMVALAESSLGLAASSNNVTDEHHLETTVDANFDFNLGLVPALFSVFMKCSNALREEIASIFRRARLLEGVWCATIVGKVFDRILELEDIKSPEEVHFVSTRRISSAQIFFEGSEGENAVVQYQSAHGTLYEVMQG